MDGTSAGGRLLRDGLGHRPRSRSTVPVPAPATVPVPAPATVPAPDAAPAPVPDLP